MSAPIAPPSKPSIALCGRISAHRVVVGGAAGRGAGFLAEARHHEVGADRHGRARARSQRGGARRVVDVGRVAGPAAALVAERRGQHLVGLVPAAGIAGAAVVFGAHRLGEDDRALVAQLLDEDVVARREIDVVGRVAAAGRAHVLGVERVLEREDDAVHRHLVERRVACRSGRRARRRVRARRGSWRNSSQTGGAPGGSGPSGGVAVELALAGHRALAADVQGGERVELAGIGLADDHAVLLLHRRVGGGRLHAAEFERRPPVFVEIGEQRRRP